MLSVSPVMWRVCRSHFAPNTRNNGSNIYKADRALAQETFEKYAIKEFANAYPKKVTPR